MWYCYAFFLIFFQFSFEDKLGYSFSLYRWSWNPLIFAWNGFPLPESLVCLFFWSCFVSGHSSTYWMSNLCLYLWIISSDLCSDMLEVSGGFWAFWWVTFLEKYQASEQGFWGGFDPQKSGEGCPLKRLSTIIQKGRIQSTWEGRKIHHDYLGR